MIHATIHPKKTRRAHKSDGELLSILLSDRELISSEQAC